jgi:predicted nucleic acid-binding protein
LKLYLDTSVVVALFVAENIMHSTVAQQAVSSATVLASGEITYAETRAAFAQLKHTKRISKNEYKRAVSDFETAWLDFERIDIDESLSRLGGVLQHSHQRPISDLFLVVRAGRTELGRPDKNFACCASCEYQSPC